jgi:hypothetical protein
MPDLHYYLWAMRVDELSKLMKTLNPTATATLKAALIEEIKKAYEGPGLKRLWHTLDETDQYIVAEAIHSPHLEHNAKLSEAKYGRKAGTGTQLFIYSHRVPEDLAMHLLEFVPQPPSAAVRVIDPPEQDEDMSVRCTEVDALAEVLALLRLADLGHLRYGEATGIPSKSSTQDLRAVMPAGDWYPPEIAYHENKSRLDQEIGSIKPVGWTRLLSAGGLITMKGQKSALTPTGRKFSQMSPWLIVRHLWERWLLTKDYDEFNRMDAIKGQSINGALSGRVERRKAVVEALGHCPEGQWVEFDAFSDFMVAAAHHFDVSLDPWKLYISDRQYGNLGHAGFHDWEILQDRYLLCFIMEYAATLGLLDIAYTEPDGERTMGDLWGVDDFRWLSRYDGLQAFRLTALGSYCIKGGQETFQPSKSSPTASLSVLLSLIIKADGMLSPAELIVIDTWAEAVEPGTWRADPARALVAVEAGRDPAEFATFLQERDSQPLPPTMHSFLRAAAENGNALKRQGDAVLFQCRDAATSAMLAAHKDLAKLCYRAGETAVCVPEKHLPAFRKSVRAMGLGIR